MQYLPEVQAKLQRADVLIGELRQGLAAFLDSDNFFVEKVKIEENVWELIVRMNSQPPLVHGVMAGEVVHNLRSSLDIGLFLLLESAVPIKFDELSEEEKKNICFPVFDVEVKYRKSVWSAKLADEQLINDLTSVQPFKNLEFATNEIEKQLMIDTTPLKELHSLWNLDKHRGVHLVVGGLDMLALGLGADELAEWKVIDPPPWKDGSKPFRITYTNEQPPSNLNLSENFAIGLVSDVTPLHVYSVVDKLSALKSQVEYCHFILQRWYESRDASR